MNEVGLPTPPLIETDRDRNKFNLLLLPHHLLDEDNLSSISSSLEALKAKYVQFSCAALQDFFIFRRTT